MNAEKQALVESEAKNKKLADEVARLQTEVNELKSASTIADLSRQDEVEVIRRKCQEEVASIQHIMKGQNWSYDP